MTGEPPEITGSEALKVTAGAPMRATVASATVPPAELRASRVKVVSAKIVTARVPLARTAGSSVRKTSPWPERISREVAAVVAQVRVEVWPRETAAGAAAKVGMPGAPLTVTLTVWVWVSSPPPLAVSTYSPPVVSVAA